MFAANNNSANALDTANTGLANGTQASVLGSNSDLKSLSTENLFTGTSSSSSAKLPDLIIEKPSEIVKATAGDKVTLTYTVKNIGSRNAGSHYVGFYLSKDDKWDSSDTLLGTNSFNKVQSLAAGASTSQTKEFTLDQNIKTGDYYVLYVADDWSSVKESKEDNNFVAKQISIRATSSPDLTVRNGDAPNTAKAGSKIKLSYTERNIGNEDAGEHKVGFYLSKDNKWDSSDTLLGEKSVKGLRANKDISRTKEFSLDENLATGDYYLLYVSDNNNSVNESNETNNFFAKKITIQGKKAKSSNLSFNDTESPINSTSSLSIDQNVEKFASTSSAPDLIIDVDNDLSPERAKAGSEISLSYNEKNIGSGDTGEHRVGFYLSKDDKWDSSDTLLGYDSVEPISAGEYIPHTKTFNLDSNIASGDYYLLYVGDDQNNVTESDETNNIVAKAISIQGKDVSPSLKDAKSSIPSASSLAIDVNNQDSLEIEKFASSSLAIDANDQDSLEIEKFASTTYSPYLTEKNTIATAAATADSETELFSKGKKIGSKR
ncbi:CARDB domain-containing protein [Calothrix sp. PCC 7507]|uniref:CARDB domain-containing protein n=1 Tax=Calothrix sp. PCC 7507 TaxID=99598 RepID=UPI00029F37AC|nr:CARDB domain-containing protein [Calothrix sp. PCC 7507]AFY32283.1 APHP domain protein [Calothrix sp. PCC 7507]